MKSNVFTIFAKFIALTYLFGLGVLIIIMFFSASVYFVWMIAYIISFLPLAGFFGIIPFQILIFIFFGLGKSLKLSALVLYYFIFMVLLFSQFILLKKLFKAISDRNFKDASFKLVAIHHILIGIVSLAFAIFYGNQMEKIGMGVYTSIVNLSLGLLLTYGIMNWRD